MSECTAEPFLPSGGTKSKIRLRSAFHIIISECPVEPDLQGNHSVSLELMSRGGVRRRRFIVELIVVGEDVNSTSASSVLSRAEN